MITVTAGLTGGSPGAGTDTPSDASGDTLMDETTGAPSDGRAETLAPGVSAGSTETNTARSIQDGHILVVCLDTGTVMQRSEPEGGLVHWTCREAQCSSGSHRVSQVN